MNGKIGGFLISILLSGIIWTAGCEEKGRSTEGREPIGEVRIKVLNGTGVRRLAWAVALDMVNKGFSVFGTGDANQRYKKTVVVDLKDEDGSNARRVAVALGVEKKFLSVLPRGILVPEIEVRIDSNYNDYVDVLLILGDDYTDFFPGVKPIY